ncbi:hypothetical protein N7492_002375 [Penicillium capsulatum]|uniref:Uncharacterized protein n=1 Tax=Penicillium capsulatum TaxID=69766 RepID=A0A9W9IIF2_9EURO|nr:hypothetical protein N7492_002375 [Penicillium capsulatum]KAJ6123020.1 hypothetical protein N7512_005485 [Penicillium capsulatum]
MENVTLKRTMLATHFLLHDEDGTTGPVCRSFQNYSDATAFLDDMEKALLKNASSAQIYNENPIFQCQYALINLKWSGTTFIMRRGSDDWQALVDRVGCAWTAKANGELNVVEFVIEVKFKN